MQASLNAFRQRLEVAAAEYLLVAVDDEGGWAEFRFIGPFRGRSVIWDARLSVLPPSPEGAAPPRQYIEVTERDSLNYDLDIGLAVSRIDTATILKTIVMIRQYKRLRPGRHEFGGGHPQYSFNLTVTDADK
jgi:hypothetical protein